MPTASSSGPFNPSLAPGLASLRKVLDEAGYLVNRLGATGVIPTGNVVLPKAEILVRLNGLGKFETLARLLAMGDVLPRQVADDALAPLGCAPLLACGLLHEEGSNVRAEAALVPVAHLLMLRDLHGNMLGGTVRDDHVLGVGLSSLAVNELTPRRSIAKALDIGTGQGIQAIGAATHAKSVVATDVNTRALRFAEMNAALAGCTNIDFRLGSFLEPVKGEEGTFDLIASNPPFVIRPPDNVVGFSAGLVGDSAVEHLVRESPKFLAEGGYAVFLANWHHTNEQDWSARPRQWLAASGCDAWLIQFQVRSPKDYALHWIREVTESEDADLTELDRWTAYYDSLKIGAISFGAFLMRKRTGDNWLREDAIPKEMRRGAAGHQIINIFENETVLRSRRPEDLLKLKLRAAPGILAGKTETLAQDGWKALAHDISHRQGFIMPLAVDDALCDLLASCDGTKPAADVIASMAIKSGVNRAFALTHGAQAVAHLMKAGYLIA